MIVTGIDTWRAGYDEIRVTYQSTNTLNRGLGQINEAYDYQAVFHVYRPIDDDPTGAL